MYTFKRIILSIAVGIGIVQCYYFLTDVSGYFINHNFDWPNLFLLPIGVLLILTGTYAATSRRAEFGTLVSLGLVILFYLIQFLRLAAVRKEITNKLFSPGEVNAILQASIAAVIFILVLAFIKVRTTEILTANWQRKWRILGEIWNVLAIILAGVTSYLLISTLLNKKSAQNFLSLGWTDGVWNIIACLVLILCLLLFLRNKLFYFDLALFVAIGLIMISNYIWASQFMYVISKTSSTTLQLWSGEIRILGIQLLTGATALFSFICYAVGGKKQKMS